MKVESDDRREGRSQTTLYGQATFGALSDRTDQNRERTSCLLSLKATGSDESRNEGPVPVMDGSVGFRLTRDLASPKSL